MRNLVCLIFLALAYSNAQTASKVIPNVSAELTLEKNVFLVGEPIMMTFTVTYTGSRSSIPISDANAYGSCGPYRVAVYPDNSPPGFTADPKCKSLFLHAFSCLSGSMSLRKGESTKRQVLLNRFGNFSLPGTYVVDVTRYVSRFYAGDRVPSAGIVTRTFAFSIAPAYSPDLLKEVLAPYIAGLDSESYERRQEAEAVITTVPAPFLEPYLIRLLERAGSSQAAIQGLRQLNSEGSRAALFHAIEAAGSSDWNIGLADALANMADAAYAPRLVALLEKTSGESQKAALLAAAARLAPQQSLPAIQRYLVASDEKSREVGVRALTATEQPEVLPMLVALLNDASRRVRGAAAEGMMSLTRESPDSSPMFWPGHDPASAAPFWNRWLAANPTLPIHLLRQCPQMSGSPWQ